MAVTLCSIAIACGTPPKGGNIEATYDKQTGKLSQLTVNAKKDGKPNIFSYMDGARFIRIEIDRDEDGKIDRWEYYAADQKLEKVGFSRLNDGKVDSWAYQAPDGSIGKIEVSTKRDRNVDRVELYENGSLVRAEQDSNGDGRPDKWETYADGVLTTAAFDIRHTGSPDRFIDYRQVAKSTSRK